MVAPLSLESTKIPSSSSSLSSSSLSSTLSSSSITAAAAAARRRQSPRRSLTRLTVFGLITLLLGWIAVARGPSLLLQQQQQQQQQQHGNDEKRSSNHINLTWNESLPSELFQVYHQADFALRPPYWPLLQQPHNNNETTTVATSSYRWGPCYLPHDSDGIDWNAQINHREATQYPTKTSTSNNMAGRCLPGFLILGAGKCGTSSLYHYLVDHPRVLPAKQKQIHYFKYHAEKPLAWYLQYFPTTRSFLSSGALLTGEASPGYLPYPTVARLVRQRMPPTGARLLVVGREPVDRAYSSYRYNYLQPTIEGIRNGRYPHIIGKHAKINSTVTDAYIQEHYLFSFEQMIRAELDVLQECLDAETGSAVVEARKRHGRDFRHEYERRKKAGLPPLVDLDGYCYGKSVSRTVPRRQWAKLVEEFPHKVIYVPNLHLVQSLIGRGLYTLPLEWWYATFERDQLHFVCTEELGDRSGAGMNKVGKFLGLPFFNFSSIVEKGAYNVGGHKGYDKEVSWDVVQNDESGAANQSEPTSVNGKGSDASIPLSPQLRQELEDFLKPMNNRLFQLTGRVCDW